MRLIHLACLLTLFCATIARGGDEPVDLTKVDRSIKAVPKFQTKEPVYCLLVFGEQAKQRAWLVIDGKRLYVDRNANGDLTEAGEKITLGDDYQETGFREFAGGKLTPDGKRTHTDLAVWMLSGTGAYIGLKIDGKLEQICYPDLSTSPKTAPVLHFDGPLQFKSVSEEIIRQTKPYDLQVMVGTPGLGEGAFVAVAHSCVPEEFQPKCEIEFASAAGDSPIRLPLLMPGRC